MQIHIGQNIREELRRQDHTNEWLAERIHVHSRTVQKIFAKNSIDTQQLLAISQAMDVDFFSIYSQCLKGKNMSVRKVQ